MSAKIPARIGAILFLLVLLHHVGFAQRLSADELNRIAESLTDQQLLTQKGKAELLRFAEKKPLEVYKGFHKAFLDEANSSVYFLNDYTDILPGRGIFPISYFDSLLNLKPDFEKEYAIREERFLATNFPTRTDVFQFLYTAAGFYRDGRSGTDSTKILADRFGAYFGPAMEPLYRDSTIEFSVSFDKDTKALEEERVKQVKPYLGWLAIFKKAGLLDAADTRMEDKFNNGKEIISSVSQRRMMDDIRALITYHDKFPYYRQQQISLLDSLIASGFINKTAATKLVENYKRDTLLNINDLALTTKNYLSLDYETEIKPFDYMTRDDYGQIPTDKIKQLYELVLQKASRLLNFKYSALEVHVLKDEAEDQMKYPNNRQFYIYVKINDILYKEMIKERELESWILPQNFQFLNHYLEDQKDPRRLYFTQHGLFTGYESQEPGTILMTLLNEKEEAFARNVYMASKISPCYNGTPGDYSYTAWERYDLTQRFTRAQVTEAVDFFLASCILKNKAQRMQLIATFREKNPVSVSNLLLELPNAFNSGGGAWTFERFLYQVNLSIKGLLQTDKDVLTAYVADYEKVPEKGDADQEMLVFSFRCKEKKYEFKVENEGQTWENNLMINTINKAFLEAGIPYGIYFLPEDSNFFRQDLLDENFVLLSPEQAEGLRNKYKGLFKVETER
ncbi:hypothetical protein SAMN05421820_116110 [Pedobacter steynii]|uniref:Uncharacterized protein n=1 Tax=Pedobacter steynii TaxID=430522 RepID=A0A1H0KP61_9SPHI|nr:hypothetical protein [Pedobacter steynii]NQX43342.1 hypothetical protein [Pedobacter steynii]SDO57586.1 hypothetical protein SAMN05421820_116110 [Pedobacter steynii]